MHNPKLQELIPQNKSDVERARRAVEAGFPAVHPILPELMAWLQDGNWPVAKVLTPFLASIGRPLIPHVRHVFETQDDIWKYWMIVLLLQPSRELAEAFRKELERLAWSPTKREESEELHEVALEALRQHGWHERTA